MASTRTKSRVRRKHGMRSEPKTQLYFEAHVTLDPVFGERLQMLKLLARIEGFRVAELLMRKGGTHEDDSFCTARDNQWSHILERTKSFVTMLRQNGYGVRRYKIEDTILDSKMCDELDLLR